jgi:hypothetical protein
MHCRQDPASSALATFPRLWPIVLASLLARRFNLQDPNYMLAGHANTMFTAFRHAPDDLSSQRVDQALVMRFDSLAAATMTAYWPMREPVPESQTLPSPPSTHACQSIAEAFLRR